jgi:hypothetical protein
MAVVSGVIAGSVVNMGLIMIGGQLVPPPEGVDVTNMESLRSSMHLFETRHFLFPFLAHAVGTLAGGFVGALLALTHRVQIALGISAVFLLGGIANVFLLPAPVWFAALDLVAAYLPMGWLGAWLATSVRPAPLRPRAA